MALWRAIVIYSGENQSPTVLQSAFPLWCRIPAYHKAFARWYAVRTIKPCWHRVRRIEWPVPKRAAVGLLALGFPQQIRIHRYKNSFPPLGSNKTRPYSGREKTLRPYRVQKLRNAKLSLAEPNEKLTIIEYHAYSRNVWHNCELIGPNDINHQKRP